jgi:hypothetical protein
MATPIQKNLVSKNEEYASSFTKGSLALPPAKKYLVGKYLFSIVCLPLYILAYSLC